MNSRRKITDASVRKYFLVLGKYAKTISRSARASSVTFKRISAVRIITADSAGIGRISGVPPSNLYRKAADLP
jgi:hypothetical protein